MMSGPARKILFGKDAAGRAEVWIVADETARDLAAEGDVIRTKEVEGWIAAAFRNTRKPQLANSDLTAIVDMLNLLRVTAAFDDKRQDPQVGVLGPWTYEQMASVRKATKVLKSELPEMLLRADRARAVARRKRVAAPVPDDDYEALARLSAAIEAGCKAVNGPFFARRKPERTTEWHEPAIAIAFKFRAALRVAGIRAGHSHPTSPLVQLIEQALTRVGETGLTVDAIAKASVARQSGATDPAVLRAGSRTCRKTGTTRFFGLVACRLHNALQSRGTQRAPARRIPRTS
jgi:hypothetical protein